MMRRDNTRLADSTRGPLEQGMAMGRRQWLGQQFGLALAVGGLGLSPVAQAADASTAAPLVIALPQVHGFGHLPLQVAKAMDVYPGLGLGVQWQGMASDRAAAQALAAGTVHAASLDFSQVLQLRAQGVGVVAIAVESRCPQLVLGVHPQARGDGRFEALKGKRVGLLGTGAGQLLTARVLQLAGLSGNDWALHVLPKADDVMDGFRAVTLDAICLDNPQVAGLEQRGELRLLADTRTIRGTVSVHGGPVPGAVLAVSSAWMRQHPAQCRTLARGVVQTLRWLQTAGPTDLVRKLPESLIGTDPSLFLFGFEKAREGLSPDAVLTPDAASAALIALLRADGKALGIQSRVADAYTNEFAEAARRHSWG